MTAPRKGKAMRKDRLFLLRPCFSDADAGEGRFHCPSCARIEGLLAFFPYLRTSLDVSYVDFPRPRAPVVELIGEENQSCPVLVLDRRPTAESPMIRQHDTTGRFYVSGADAISLYLSQVYGVSLPHP